MIFANLSDFLRFWVVFGLNLPDLGPKRWLEGPRAPIKPPGDHQGAQNVKLCCFLVPFLLPALIAAQWSLLRHDSTEPSSHPMLTAAAEIVLAYFASGAATAAPSFAIDVPDVELP